VFYFDFVFLEKTGRFHRYKSRIYKLQSGTYLKLDFTKVGSDEYRQNLLRMYEALMVGAHIRLLGSEVEGAIDTSIKRGKILCTFSMDGLSQSHRIDNTIGAAFPESIYDDIEKLDNLIEDFIVQNSVPTHLSRPYDILFLNRYIFVKTLIKATKLNRIKYFKQNIKKKFIEKFNKEIAPSLSDADKELWKVWYKEYITEGDKNDIDQPAIVIFISIMTGEGIDVIDDWFRNPDEFDFDAIEIELQPWFSPEFLVLRKYFPNIQNVD